MFIPSIIKSINEYTITIADLATSGNVTVAENLNFATIEFRGADNDDGGGTGGAGGTPANASYRFTVSGSVITATRGSNGGAGRVATIYLTVKEYYPGLMLQAIQRGTINTGGGGFVSSSALTAMGSKYEARYLGMAMITGDAVLGNQSFTGIVRKKDSTHVEANSPSGFASFVSFEAVDWR